MDLLNIVRKINTALAPSLCAAAVALGLSSCSGIIPDESRFTLRDEAVELYSSGDYAAAIVRFNEALKVSVGEVSELQYDILRYRAECELRTGDYDAALSTYEALLELDKDSGGTAEYEALMDELDTLTRIKEAAQLFETGEYTRAYAAYKEYAALDGTASGEAAWYNMAVCAEYLGNFEEAAVLFNQFAAAYPEDEQAAREAEFCRSRSAEE